MKAASPFLTAQEAADHLRFPTLGAFRFYLWQCRQAGTPVKTYHRGGKLLFTVHDLDASMQVEEADGRRGRLRAVTK